ncbi:hypothetical protein [Nitrosomonas aestuarii]|uniref:hypothetical protein n=1 Tax=Nitrosomonas aestuarii TaxID=52441 RepID=UPI001BA48432|nr:hypothetical protein [Nitrosomonas aestuarii]
MATDTYTDLNTQYVKKPEVPDSQSRITLVRCFSKAPSTNPMVVRIKLIAEAESA